MGLRHLLLTWNDMVLIIIKINTKIFIFLKKVKMKCQNPPFHIVKLYWFTNSAFRREFIENLIELMRITYKTKLIQIIYPNSLHSKYVTDAKAFYFSS